MDRGIKKEVSDIKFTPEQEKRFQEALEQYEGLQSDINNHYLERKAQRERLKKEKKGK